MSLGSVETDDDERVAWRIEEMLEASERNGMSKKGLTRARKMVAERFRSIWATTLTPQDYAIATGGWTSSSIGGWTSSATGG